MFCLDKVILCSVILHSLILYQCGRSPEDQAIKAQVCTQMYPKRVADLVPLSPLETLFNPKRSLFT